MFTLYIEAINYVVSGIPMTAYPSENLLRFIVPHEAKLLEIHRESNSTNLSPLDLIGTSIT